METRFLLQAIKDSAFEVRKHLCPGYLESVYENALEMELKLRGISVKRQIPINVNYKGFTIGDFRVDMLVEDKVIVELKSVTNILPIHEAQLVNYLTCTGIDDGILVNFGEVYACRHKTRIWEGLKFRPENH